MSTSDAVADGIKSTAGVVTSAAIVMVAVFSIFAILPEIPFKQLGVGPCGRRADRRDKVHASDLTGGSSRTSIVVQAEAELAGARRQKGFYVHRALKARAAAGGVSLSEYVRGVLERTASMAIDFDRFVFGGHDRSWETPEDRVGGHQMGEHARVDEIVHGDHFDVRVAFVRGP